MKEELNNKIALALLKKLSEFLNQQMEFAKTHTDEKSVNRAGMCSEIKSYLSYEKAKIIGNL